MPKSFCTQPLVNGRSCSRRVWDRDNNKCKFHSHRAAKKEYDDLHTAGAATVWPTLVKGDVVRVFGQINATQEGARRLPWNWMRISEISGTRAHLWPLKNKTVFNEKESNPVTQVWMIYPDPESLVEITDLEFVAHPNGKVVAPKSNIQNHFFLADDDGRRCTGIHLWWTKWADMNSGLEHRTSCD